MTQLLEDEEPAAMDDLFGDEAAAAPEIEEEGEIEGEPSISATILSLNYRTLFWRKTMRSSKSS